MRIAFTHNLQLTDSEEEAEFDSPETVAGITRALEKLGHRVEPVEVSGPASRTVARLEALSPDLIFNTAEGRHGRYREAFYPALFEHLGMPFTGSDAYVCALTLDKQLTKTVLAQYDIPTPRWAFIETAATPVPTDLRFPVIVKPNFEGSSKGITQDSVIEDPAALGPRLAELIRRYPTGLLVEEFIVGRDIVVPFLEKASPATGGILESAEYLFDPEVTAGRKHAIYDYDLKQNLSHAVSVKSPASVPPAVRKELVRLSRLVMERLGIRDLGRIDYRLTPEGQLFFIEVNALPSLEMGAGIFVAARRAGLKTPEAVLGSVLESAAARQGLVLERSRRARKVPRVGLTYNLKRVTPRPGGEADEEAEYDAPSTIDAVRKAIASYGHEVILLEATSELPSILPAAGVDVVFNIAEGIKGRNRESQVPAMLELLDIEYTGSDPASLSLALDKGLAKRIVQQAGVRTPPFFVMTTGRERVPKGFSFPAVVKPVAEGSSKGVVASSVVESEEELRAMVLSLVTRYKQRALVEAFLPGREFTVGLLGERRPRALPPMEIVFLDKAGRNPVYTFDHKLELCDEVRYDAPADVAPALLRELERVAKDCFQALGCRDVARVDLRLDDKGRVNFIECNPLPGLTPGWSDLCLIAESAGMEYRTLIGEILAPALRRYKDRFRGSARTRVETSDG